MRRSLAAVLLAVLALGACGGGDDEKTSSGSSTTSQTKTTGQAAGTPFCKKAAELKEASQQQPTDPNAPDALRIAYEQAAEATAGHLAVVPDELKADLTAMNDATQKLLEALRQVDFDMSKLPPDIQAILQDTELQAASSRVGEYLQVSCGIDSSSGSATTTTPPATDSP
jgi:hypothetical protein